MRAAFTAFVAVLLSAALAAGPAQQLWLAGRAGAASGGGGTLAGQWKFNDGSGSTTVDDSGNGNAGTLVNSPTWGTGPNSNGALVFSAASSQYVDLGNPTALQITGALSVSAWVYIDTTLSDMQIVAKDGESGGRPWNLTYQHQGGTVQKFRFIVNDGAGGNQFVSDTVTPSANTWYHLVGTYDPSVGGGTLKIYRDGSLIATQTGAGTSIPAGTAHVLVGRRTYSGFEEYLSGKVDDVRIYNVCLTSTEVGNLYTAGAQ